MLVSYFISACSTERYLPQSFSDKGPGRSIAWEPYPLAELDKLDYEVVNGTAPTIAFDRTKYSVLDASPMYSPISSPFDDGQLLHGYYTYGDTDGSVRRAPVVSFRYNKGGDGGESHHRLVVRTGVGAGTFEEHVNLPPCETVVGPQIGTFDPVMMQYRFEKPGEILVSKHFPVICYFGGPLGDYPLSADHWPEVGC